MLRLRQKKFDIEDLGVQGETLEFHPPSGHPIARLLPSVKNAIVGAAPDEHFVEAAAARLGTDIESIYESNWSDMGETHFVNLKKGVRRRFEILEVFTWAMACPGGGGGARLGRCGADNFVFRLGFAAHGGQEEGVELRGTRATGRDRGGLAVCSFFAGAEHPEEQAWAPA